MDKSLFNELCREEDQLVEKLRVLREFKNTFFNSGFANPLPELKVENTVEQPNSEHKNTLPQKGKKAYKKRTVLTVPGMVLNALSAIGSGSTQQITEKLVQLYPSVPLEKASKDTKHHVSLLSKNDKILIIQKRPGKLGFIYQSK